MTVAEPSVQTDGSYRDRIVAVEPGGNESIAEADRHGHPHQLFWTWSSPNLEFVTIGVRLPAHIARALVTVFFGVAGFLVAWWALADAAASYEAFLLIIAYWIGPWLGVVFADQYLRRGQTISGFLYDRSYANWGGLLSFAVGLVLSVLLFSNQKDFVGFVAKAVPQLGDITFFVGFLIAGASYLLVCRSKITAERAAV